MKNFSLKTGYIEFAIAGNYLTIGIVQICSHWAPGEGGRSDSEPQLPWQPPG